MTAQHTPGPWAYDPESGAIFRADNAVEPLVASTNFEGVSIEQGNADGWLIAAAPDLLAFAAQVARMKTQAEADGLDMGNDLAMDGLIGLARAAIAKAEGRS